MLLTPGRHLKPNRRWRQFGSHVSFIKNPSDSESGLPGIHTPLEGYPMTTQTSRRAVLAGAAALPVFALPALSAPAYAATGNVSFPELAARYAAIYPRWLTQSNLDEAHLAKFEAAVTEATGIPRNQQPNFGDEGYEAYSAIRCDLSKTIESDDPVDEHGCSIVWKEIHDEIFPLVREILEQPARSITDLALQAQAFALGHTFYWIDHRDDDDSEGKEVRAIIDSVCKFCGVDPLPGAKLYAVQS
jgi:hypothetical protein